MEKYKYNKEYKVCINKDGNIFDYYLEKKYHGDLYWMFGLEKKIEFERIAKIVIEENIQNAKKRKFWE